MSRVAVRLLFAAHQAYLLAVNVVNIHFEWPPRRQPVSLVRNLIQGNAATFDVLAGAFDVHSAHAGHDAIMFYWHMTRLVMMNLCSRCVCRLDDIDVAYGSIHPLRESSRIQAGHFKMSVISDAQLAHNEPLTYGSYSSDSRGADSPIHDVEDILPNKGNYINDLRYLNNVILTQDKEVDILKMLAVEYKRFLIWQEQDNGGVIDVQPQKTRIIRTDAHFEHIREKIKEKTLTECIVDSDSLIEKALSELGMDEQWNELFTEEEKTDLLHALSPEVSVMQGRDNISELVFQDLRKIGLDTHY